MYVTPQQRSPTFLTSRGDNTHLHRSLRLTTEGIRGEGWSYPSNQGIQMEKASEFPPGEPLGPSEEKRPRAPQQGLKIEHT